jgi:hypothetical protein
MARYYELSIFGELPTAGVSTLGLSTPGLLNGPPTLPSKFGFNTANQIPIRKFTTHPNGIYDPAALQIEFDVLAGPAGGTPMGASSITVRGVPLSDITQAFQFAGMTLELKAGMKAPGLPLIKPDQAGTILKGLIYQSFGNWEGTDQRIDFVVVAGGYTIDNPGNFVLNWTTDTSLADALKNTFSIAYPGVPVDVNTLANDLKITHDEVHVCGTIDELAKVIGDVTENYDGERVEISIQNGRIIIYDRFFSPPKIQLDFNDLIGQPAWLNINTIQMQAVMRSDLGIGSIVTMPKGLQNTPGLVTATPNSSVFGTAKSRPTFDGDFIVNGTRHVGNLRAADGRQWATIFNCTAVPAPSKG